MPDDVLSRRALNRALLERQLLLRRSEVAVADAVEHLHVPLVQVPPRGVWGAGGQARYATLEAWTGRVPEASLSVDDVIVRYLRAFGPASVMDAQNWSGLTRLKDAFERLRPSLLTFRDEEGRELFDLPDAPRPDPGVHAPVRFLGEFDNVLLGHADRRRVIPDDLPSPEVLAGGRSVGNVLVDGMLRATWWLEREGRRRATLVVRPVAALAGPERDEVAGEARRLLEFAASETAARDVRLEAAVRPR